jgi:hexosaminidase
MDRIAVLLILWLTPAWSATVSPLFSRGYTVLPQPQAVRLAATDFAFSGAWAVELQGIGGSDPAVQRLHEELDSRFRLKLATSRGGSSRATGTLRLVIAAGSARVGEAQDRDRDILAREAYRIELAPNRVTITANAPAGLYYGVVTLVQLLKPRGGALLLPEGEIEDWPDLRRRQIYWDDAHHLERLDAMKQAIRQAAFFKINGFILKLEGHFQYRSAPALVEPQALSPAQLQELTDFGLRHHVQVIPYLDSPGHIAFILKHPEYARLREYPDNNYELCVTNPDSYRRLFGMFQDLLDANKGVSYFYLSTDEAYYIGLANNSQCQEAQRAKELGGVGKLLAEFVTKASTYLHDRGRTVVFWGESPLKPEDIASLPPHVVNGETYGPRFDPLFRKQGIREMIYTSSEGEEKLVPEYFPLPASRRLHPERPASRRVFETFQKIAFDSARRDADLIGMINAGWADMGLHPETFWLGYATAGAAGWHPGSPDAAESMAAFYPLFYGRDVTGMDRTYQLMSTQAQFWSDSWETAVSKARKPIWGNSNGPIDPPRPARDQTLVLPPVPGADLRYVSDWGAQNARRLQLASEFLTENDELLGLLRDNVPRADGNGYNLEVFLSIAGICRQNLEMLQSLGRMDALLRSAADAAGRNQPRAAVNSVDQALQQAWSIRYSRNRVLADTIETWQKSWLPRVGEANGRRFLHELDDVKDHLPDRTVDMTYLVYRELQLPFGDWVEQVRAARNEYARAHGLPVASERFDWNDLTPVYRAPSTPEE